MTRQDASCHHAADAAGAGSGWADGVIRAAAGVTVVGLAGVAGAISYSHMRGLADRQLALERSQRLAHMTGVNWFFVSLTAHARLTGEGELRVWLSEAATRGWLNDASLFKLTGPDMPNPDGLGVWAAHGGEVRFLLEYDTGTEHLPQLSAKLPAYATLAQTMARLGGACPPLLFCFPTPHREQSARRALAAGESRSLRIATTAVDPETTSPAGCVWLPSTPAAPRRRSNCPPSKPCSPPSGPADHAGRRPRRSSPPGRRRTPAGAFRPPVRTPFRTPIRTPAKTGMPAAARYPQHTGASAPSSGLPDL